MLTNDIKDLLNFWAEKTNIKDFIENDPVKFLHRYKNTQDIEVVAFFASMMAWGNRKMILNSLERIFSIMGDSPFDFVQNVRLDSLVLPKSIHRTFNAEDFVYFVLALREFYQKNRTLERFFIDSNNFANKNINNFDETLESKVPQNTQWENIANFRDSLLISENRANKHLGNPHKNSACKRIHLMLRWLVRDDGIVDLGIWKAISPATLSIPLDTHVGNIARNLGLISRNQNDKKAVLELDSALRSFCPNDPCKYDFALFGIGVNKVILSDNQD